MLTKNPIALWLFACCLMVTLMVTIGGVTRLTGSGLSMTDWKPVTGWLPPIGDTQWAEEFSRYQMSPQYMHLNHGMDVHGFKGIFWLEYIHRLVGRVTGLVFFLPLMFFIARRKINRSLALRLGGIFLLGGSQGVVGWLMVSSGLKDNPYVSQYWLAFHLGMAFVIFALLFLLALGQCGRAKVEVPRCFRMHAYGVIALVFVQVLLGAFVAGLDAGLTYNTFPLMDGKWIPDGLGLAPNPLDNIIAVQFMHRTMAYVVTAAVISLWFAARKLEGRVRCGTNALLVMVAVQFALGVLTLLNAVPTPLASMHQVGALVLFALALWVGHGNSLDKKGQSL